MNLFAESFCYVSNYKGKASVIDFFGNGLFYWSGGVIDVYATSFMTVGRIVPDYPIEDSKNRTFSNMVFAQDYEKVLCASKDCEVTQNGIRLNTSFNYSADERDLILEILADDKESFNDLSETMAEWTAYDILMGTPGIIVYKGWYRRGYLHSCENEEFDETEYNIRKTYKVVYTDQKWTRIVEGTYNYTLSADDAPVCEWAISDVTNYDFQMLVDSAVNNTNNTSSSKLLSEGIILIGGYACADLVFRFRTYGSASKIPACCMLVENTTDKVKNPNCLAYGINYVPSKSVESVTVNTRERTITEANGNNLFSYRFDGSFPFKKLEKYKIYDFHMPRINGVTAVCDIMILEERDEPGTWI